MLSHEKTDSVINVKVEFGEGEGKVPLDNIARRAEVMNESILEIAKQKNQLHKKAYDVYFPLIEDACS